MREQAFVSREDQEIRLGGDDFSPVNIEDVAQRGEGEEGDSNRQDYSGIVVFDAQPKPVKNRLERISSEIEILKKS